MPGHLRLKSPWSQLGMFLALFSACYLLTGVISLIILAATNVTASELMKPNLQNQHLINVIKIIQAISSVSTFILPSFLFAVITFTGRYGYFLGFKKAEKTNMYVLAAICILLALPFAILLGDINQRIPLPHNLTEMEETAGRQMSAFLKIRTPADIYINLFIVALLPAIGEELCFRGVLQRMLIQITKSPWVGIIITAMLFSSLHMQFGGFLPRMFLGIILGAFYWYSGSIWTSILAHLVYNAVQVLIVAYAPKYVTENPDTPLLAAIASGIVVWAILWFFLRQSTVTYAKVYRTDDLTPHNQFLA